MSAEENIPGCADDYNQECIEAELERKESTAIVKPGDKGEPMSLQPRNMDELARVSAMCFSARGSFVPDHFRSAAEIGAAIMMGQELGLGVMTSLHNAQIIKGKVAWHYSVLVGVMRGRGCKVTYPTMEREKVTIHVEMPDGSEYEDTWDKQRAIDNELWGRGHWKKDPQVMLLARAVGHAYRACGFGKMYEPGELDDSAPSGPSPHGNTPEERAEMDQVIALQARKETESLETFDALLETLTAVASEDEFYSWVRCNAYDMNHSMLDKHRKKLWVETKLRASVLGKMKEFGISREDFNQCEADALAEANAVTKAVA